MSEIKEEDSSLWLTQVQTSVIPQKTNLTIISGKRPKKSQEDTSENKADETLTSLRRDGQSKEDKQK